VRVGLLGCGAIGGSVANAVLSGELKEIQICSIVTASREPHCAELLGAKWSTRIEDFGDAKLDVIVEAASQMALRNHAHDCVRFSKRFILMSVGALGDQRFRESLICEAQAHACEIIVPSGAIGGLDILRAARQHEALSSVSLSIAKPPRALAGAPYLIEHQIDLTQIQSRQVLFEGQASEAVFAFPQNVNIAAAVSLAGIGFDRTQIRIVADPTLERTTITLEANGKFGDLSLNLVNTPHPSTPKTSYLACLAAISTIANLQSTLRVGG